MAKTIIEPIYPDIGRRIQQAREQAHLSQAALGTELRPSLTRAAIANMEGGKQRILVHTLVNICQILRVSLSDLLPYNSNQISESPSSPIKEVRTDLMRYLSKATADRLITKLPKDNDHEPPIRSKRRRKASGDRA